MTYYNIRHTNGTLLANIEAGNADTVSSDLTLFGKNYPGYGPLMDENLVKLLENFSNSAAPTNPQPGQLWWDSANKVLNVRRDNAWQSTSGPTVSNVAPTISQVGDLWWDTSSNQLKSFNGTAFEIIGPGYSTTQGVTGSVVATAIDSNNNEYSVVLFYTQGTIVAVLSGSTATYTPTNIPGFTSTIIKKGFNLPVTNGTYYGNAENALSLGGTLAANYVRSDVASLVNIGITTNTNNSIDIGGTGHTFRNIYGNTIANGADLAEKYVADANYPPGTVLMFGGEKEVTLCDKACSNRIAGVVTTKPAYLMNDDCEGEYVVAIALVGRCPVKVIGRISKGDMLVSAGNGVAMYYGDPKIGTVIGKALENSNGSNTIEVAIGRC